MIVPTSPQNSIRVCQSRPLRASREASRHSTAPTSPAQTVATSLSKPGRATLPLAGFDNWMLLAVSGGRPVDIAGEWNGRVLFPLAVAAEGTFHALRGEE